MSDAPEEPGSAVELAAALGDLIDPANLAADCFDLVAAIRELTAAAVGTDLAPRDRRRIADAVRELAEQLEGSQRNPTILLGRHSDGRLENLTQAGSGRLNPHAPPLVFDALPASPAQLENPVAVEVRATFQPTTAHMGPPGKLHGGVVATVLDEVLGVAATAAGASGLTAGIDVRFRAATPVDRVLEVTARFSHREGRKAFATGEVRADGQVTAKATAVFIASS